MSYVTREIHVVALCLILSVVIVALHTRSANHFGVRIFIILYFNSLFVYADHTSNMAPWFNAQFSNDTAPHV